MNKEYNIIPVPKPRMTQSNKWRISASQARYNAFKDECRVKDVFIPDCGADINFYIPMPKSWTKKKKREYLGSPHQQTPDLDNLLKALFDALFKKDQHIWSVKATKVWCDCGKIVIKY